jgi:superfamily II helicase
MFPLSTLISLRDRLKRLKEESIDCKSEETQRELSTAIAEISFAIERLEAELTSAEEIEKLTRKLAQPKAPPKGPENPPQPFPHIIW